MSTVHVSKLNHLLLAMRCQFMPGNAHKLECHSKYTRIKVNKMRDEGVKKKYTRIYKCMIDEHSVDFWRNAKVEVIFLVIHVFFFRLSFLISHNLRTKSAVTKWYKMVDISSVQLITNETVPYESTRCVIVSPAKANKYIRKAVWVRRGEKLEGTLLELRGDVRVVDKY